MVPESLGSVWKDVRYIAVWKSIRFILLTYQPCKALVLQLGLNDSHLPSTKTVVHNGNHGYTSVLLLLGLSVFYH